MSSPSNEKRKDKDGTDRPAPEAVRKEHDESRCRHLPAPIWGNVLDFMPYDEVRSALLVNKAIATEAVKYVHALSFTKVCQMDGPSARRFPNVEELKILCMYNFDTEILCKETCQRMVPLLIGFPKLKWFFSGGVCFDEEVGEYNRPYTGDFSNKGPHPENRKTFRVLINHILSAYKMRLFPHTVETLGEFCDTVASQVSHFRSRGEDAAEPLSSLFNDICSHFPLADVLASDLPHISNIDIHEIYGIIQNRPGGKEMIRDFSGQYLVENFLNVEMEYFNLEENVPDSPDTLELWQRLSQAGVECVEGEYDACKAQFLTHDALKCLDDLIGVGFDPRIISREDLYRRFDIGNENRRYDVFAKATFDALVSRGFAFDEKDVIVLDETKEPVLSKIPALIRGDKG